MRKGDKGKKVLGLIAILAIIVSVFGGVVSAEDVSGGLKQSVDDAEIQTAVGNLSSEELTKALGADQSCPIGPVLVSAKPASSPRCYQCGDRTDDCFCNRENPCICCDNNCDGDCLDGCDGNCCWWAWDRACCLWGVGLKWCTNGGTWADKARSYEYRVSDTPEVGTIADGRSIPHVAWVVSVSEDKARVTVSEMNCWGICGNCSNPADPSNSVRTWEYSASVFEYIYPLTITAQSIYSSPASPGDELTFVYKIKNPSDRAVSNIRLGARIRTNSPQGSWIDDPTNDKVISVDPGEKDYSRKFRIPSDVSSGYYDAGWVIVNQNTDEYQVAEAWVDENVMNRILCIESSAQPDLIVEDIWVDPDPPIAGASNRISYRIKNQGGGDAVGTFRTNRYFDGALDGHADTSGLTAGSTKTYYKDMTWPSDSNLHAIKAITDVNGAISESNAGNNERSESFSAECSTPDAPTLTSPGTSSEPGEGIDTLTPTFRWQAVSGADQYGLYISKYPYGSSNIVYENEAISGSSTSLPLPSGYLQDGVKYRWNMRAHNSAGWSSYGIEDGKTRLYFWVNIVPPNRVKGIDVSEYQGNINWPTVYDSGYRFAFARASLGDENPPTLIDDYFETNMENGHAAGMLMGAYHFAYPNYGTVASSEARHFLNVAREYLKEGYLRPVLDLEQGEELGKEALSNWVHEWMNTVKSETGIEPIIYVNSNYANNYLDSSVTQYDLWIAHWRCDTGTPPNTGIWNDWVFWQYYSPDYCGVNSVPGISGGVDLDIFNGDMDRLYTFVIESEEPALSLSSTSHDFLDKCEGVTDSTTFEIWNSGTGTLTYTLSETCSWMDVNPTSGSSTGGHDTITVDIDTTGLSEGLHTCDISIGSNDGSGTFTVTVNIVAKTGSISVSSSPSGANIYLDGSYIGGQTPYTITNVPAGTHTLKLTLGGYYDWSTNVQVTAGETSYVYATLTPISSTAPTAIFRNGVWCVDTTGNHIADLVFGYGIAGDVPIVGDFNKDGSDDIAIFRNGVWCVDTTGNRIADLVFCYGIAGDVPIVGDFNKDGSDDIAIFRNGIWCVDTTGNRIADLVFCYGIAGDVPIVGHFNKDGSDDIAIFRNGIWCVDTTGNHIADLVFGYGIAGDVPLVGDIG